MRINHRMAGRSDNPFWLEIDYLGLEYERGDWHVLNVTEDHPQWPEVERLCDQYSLASHFTDNIFSPREMDAAEWFQLSATGQHGYPMPDDDFGYLEATYDVADLCPICGIGGVQKAPFRLRAEPKAAHSQFLQVNWVYDEFFLRGAAADGLAKAGITGIEFLSPVLHKLNQPSEQVVQMTAKTILPRALDLAGLEPVTCAPHNEEWRPDIPLRPAELQGHPYCGRVKYHPRHRGPFKLYLSAFRGAPDIVKSQEWFGSGGSAHRLVIVSQRFRQIVTGAKWRGLRFEPIELVGTPTRQVHQPAR